MEIFVTIAGYCYGIRFNMSGKILETCCEGRWSWTTCSIGDKWLMDQLERAALDALDK